MRIVTVFVPQELLTEIGEVARQEHRSRNSCVRQAMAEFCKRKREVDSKVTALEKMRRTVTTHGAGRTIVGDEDDY